MSEVPAEDQVEEIDPYEVLPLTDAARVTVSLNTTFRHAGNSHWAKVVVEDGVALLDPGEAEDGSEAVFESTGDTFYRVGQNAHRQLWLHIAQARRAISEDIATQRAQAQSGATE
jgi:hypothetical protein